MSTQTLTRSPAEYWQTGPEHHAEGASTPIGFWVYLMTDCLMFAVLFATFGVLSGSFAAGPGPRDLFDLGLVAVNTTMLLLSSITFGFAMVAAGAGRRGAVLGWLAVTLLLGGLPLLSQPVASLPLDTTARAWPLLVPSVLAGAAVAALGLTGAAQAAKPNLKATDVSSPPKSVAEHTKFKVTDAVVNAGAGRAGRSAAVYICGIFCRGCFPVGISFCSSGGRNICSDLHCK